jgi:Ubiquitin family
MFTSEKTAISKKRSVSIDQSGLPLLGGDKKNDGHQSERLYVKIKSGDTSEIEIDISERETVDELKTKLISKLNIVGKRIRLIASGRMLEPGSKDFKVNSGAFIHVVITENIPSSTASSNRPAVNESTAVPSNTTFRGLDQLSEGAFFQKNLFCIISKPLTPAYVDLETLHILGTITMFLTISSDENLL